MELPRGAAVPGPAPSAPRRRGGRRGARGAPPDPAGVGAGEAEFLEENRWLSALRTLLRKPPQAVEDDVASQAWMEGLICATDCLLRGRGADPVAPTPPAPSGGQGEVRAAEADQGESSGAGRRRRPRNRSRAVNSATSQAGTSGSRAATLQDLRRLVRRKGETLRSFSARFRRTAEQVQGVREDAIVLAYLGGNRCPILSRELMARVVRRTEDLWSTVDRFEREEDCGGPTVSLPTSPDSGHCPSGCSGGEEYGDAGPMGQGIPRPGILTRAAARVLQGTPPSRGRGQ